MGYGADTRLSRSVNIPEDILDQLGVIARAKRLTIRGLIIEVLEDHLREKYPNLEDTIKAIAGESED